MSDQRQPSRRQRRRDQILNGATRVFARKGFHAATTREIAEAADVSEGTIYNYFDSKDDLLLHLMARLRDEEQRSMEVAPDTMEQALSIEVRELLERVLRALQAFATENTSLLRAVVSQILVDRGFAEQYYEQVTTPTLQLLEQHLESRIEQGQIRPVNAALYARYFLAVTLGLFELLFLDDPVLTTMWGSDALIEELTGFLLDGLKPGQRSPERDDA